MLSITALASLEGSGEVRWTFAAFAAWTCFALSAVSGAYRFFQLAVATGTGYELELRRAQARQAVAAIAHDDPQWAEKFDAALIEAYTEAHKPAQSSGVLDELETSASNPLYASRG